MNYFSFNSDNYNFWPIYECIQKYYPIGIRKSPTIAFKQYAGIVEVEELLKTNIHNTENFNEKWGTFLISLQEQIGLKIIGDTMGQAPSFSARIVLSENKYKTIHHRKELHLMVSLLGPFYQLYGKDTTSVWENEKRVVTSTPNLITSSPMGEYESLFSKVETIIQQRFSTHRKIPFFVSQFFVEGLQVVYADNDTATVHQALFNDDLSSCQRTTIRGNKKYGLEVWRK